MKTLTVKEWQTSDNENTVTYNLSEIAFIRFENVDFDGQYAMGLIIEFLDQTTATFKAENWFIDFDK